MRARFHTGELGKIGADCTTDRFDNPESAGQYVPGVFSGEKNIGIQIADVLTQQRTFETAVSKLFPMLSFLESRNLASLLWVQ